MIGFFTYLGCSVLFYALAIHARVSKRPVGIWSHEMKRPKVDDVKGYNCAVARLFLSYGTALLVLGLPMLLDENPLLVLLFSVLGVAFVTIIMFVKAIRIDEKYRGRY